MATKRALPTLLGLIAFILTLLCLFAGSSGFLEDFAVLTLDTSRMKDPLSGANTSLFERGHLLQRGLQATRRAHSGSEAPSNALPSTIKGKLVASRRRQVHAKGWGDDLSGDLPDNVSGDLPDDVSGDLPDDLSGDLPDDLSGDLPDDLSGDLPDSLTQGLDVYDYYSVYVLTYCWGNFDAEQPGDSNKTLVACSDRQAFLSFDPQSTSDPAKSVSEKRSIDPSISDLLPDEAVSAARSLAVLQKTAFVLFCLLAFFNALTLLLCLAAHFLHFILKWMLVGPATLALIASVGTSVIITLASSHGASAINDFGQDMGISAQSGYKIVTTVWAATVLLFLDWAMLVV